MSQTETHSLRPRIERLRQRALDRGNGTGGKAGVRALARMNAWKKHPGLSWVQWRAYTLRELVAICPVSIGEDERIVGEHLFDINCHGLDFGWATEGFEKTDLDEATRKELAAFAEQGLRMAQSPYADVGESLEGAPPGVGWGHTSVDNGIYWASGWSENHSIRDFAKVIRIGFEGIRDEIQAECDAACHWEPDFPGKHNFWLAALAVCEAGAALGRRFADEARTLGEQASDETCRERLERLAEVAERVPARGARTLREAVQALWFATC